MSTNKELANITPEEEAVFAKNREESPYVRRFEKDGVSYPIPDLIGSTRLILVDEDTVGAHEITFGFSEFAPKSSVHKLHIHPNSEEIMYILKGRGVSNVAGLNVMCEEGDTLYVPKGVEHSFYNPFPEPCSFLFLYTKGSLKEAGYALASAGYHEIGDEIQKLQKLGTNKFDSR